MDPMGYRCILTDFRLVGLGLFHPTIRSAPGWWFDLGSVYHRPSHSRSGSKPGRPLNRWHYESHMLKATSHETLRVIHQTCQDGDPWKNVGWHCRCSMSRCIPKNHGNLSVKKEWWSGMKHLGALVHERDCDLCMDANVRLMFFNAIKCEDLNSTEVW